MQNDFLKLTVNGLFSLVAVFCLTGFVFGQEAQTVDNQGSDDIAPPPVFAMSGTEKSQLTNESDLKRRTQLCLMLADARLRRAEEATDREDFQAALLDLGSYQAIIENHIKFLERGNYSDGKVRDNFRRMDITLRSYTPRIETIRRTTPFEFAVHLKSILNFTRDARARALDSFFSDSILSTETAGGITPTRAPQPAVSGGNGFSKEKKP
ncbi:MAG TPA: hypothetical protein VEQ34_03655 [Pyrinomonadaceae bacterium]|nr:hypothetical protein [Pyrinomonadaceae bacterium]